MSRKRNRLATVLREEGLIKTAGQDPISVSKKDIRNGDAFMTYLVNADNNNSRDLQKVRRYLNKQLALCNV